MGSINETERLILRRFEYQILIQCFDCYWIDQSAAVYLNETIMDIREIDQMNRKEIDDFIIRQWFSLQMVLHGESVDLGAADGWYAVQDDEIVGLITYRILDDRMEILSLDSLNEHHGIGTALLNMAVSYARNSGIIKITLITTNDNLPALRFYQKRGFDMARLFCNAVDLSRKLKPEIPLFGLDGIPLKHEIELELDIYRR